MALQCRRHMYGSMFAVACVHIFAPISHYWLYRQAQEQLPLVRIHLTFFRCCLESVFVVCGV